MNQYTLILKAFNVFLFVFSVKLNKTQINIFSEPPTVDRICFTHLMYVFLTDLMTESNVDMGRTHYYSYSYIASTLNVGFYDVMNNTIQYGLVGQTKRFSVK